MDKEPIETVLRKVMEADEDVTIPTKTVNALVGAGLVVKRWSSDGNYIELTDKGREALASQS